MMTAAIRLSPIPRFLFVLLLACDMLACGRPAPDRPADTSSSHAHDHGHQHHHEAPRGGTLVELGDHVAHIEFLLDSEIGLLRAYILDGHAEHPVRLADTALDLEITPEGAADSFTLTLEAQANPLTGETPGGTSEFAGRADDLIGVERFTGHLPALRVRGVAIPALSFNFPEGRK